MLQYVSVFHCFFSAEQHSIKWMFCLPPSSVGEHLGRTCILANVNRVIESLCLCTSFHLNTF